jgi:hypothetical protein
MKGLREMNRNITSKHLNRNLEFFIVAVGASLTFLMQIHSALFSITGGGVINNVQYSIFHIEIDVSFNTTFSHVYDIWNYPLIPIFAGLIYNAYALFKNYKTKDILGL